MTIAHLLLLAGAIVLIGAGSPVVSAAVYRRRVDCRRPAKRDTVGRRVVNYPVLLLLVGCGPTTYSSLPSPAVYSVPEYEASIRRLLSAEESARETQQQSGTELLDYRACYRLLNAVPTDAISPTDADGTRPYLTPRERDCAARVLR
jgi:hypothetical protein